MTSSKKEEIMLIKTAILGSALALAPVVASAAGSHSGGHGMAIGAAAGNEPSRTVEIVMRETDSGEYVFEPGELRFSEGETVRLHIVNAGEQEHEFVMDTPHSIAEHKVLMEKFPEMEHDEPNAVRLRPGEEADIVWTFGEEGTYQFACLLLGHYEAGMHGSLIVN
jgi:uncharacterized cupredoxin-like copper-binding protein